MPLSPKAGGSTSRYLSPHPAGCPPKAVLPLSWAPALTVPLSQASSGVKQWNKRWFVLVDRCLFYYKGTAMQSRVLQGKPGLLQSSSA